MASKFFRKPAWTGPPKSGSGALRHACFQKKQVQSLGLLTDGSNAPGSKKLLLTNETVDCATKNPNEKPPSESLFYRLKAEGVYASKAEQALEQQGSTVH